MKKYRLLLIAIYMFSFSTAFAVPRYTIEPITFSNDSGLAVTYSGGTSINHSGVVVGSAVAEGTPMAFRGKPPQGAELLPLVQTAAYAEDINDRSITVGTDRQYGAVLWTKDGEILGLGVDIGMDASGRATAINNRSQVVGNCSVCGQLGFHQGWIWDKKDGIRRLLSEYPIVTANDINNAGQVVGHKLDVPNIPPSIPFVLDTATGTLTEINTHGTARAINDRSVVTGEIYKTEPDSTRPGFVWDADTGITLLPFLEGADWSRPWCINNRGSIVGVSSLIGRRGNIATIWYDGVVFDLNTLLDNGEDWSLEIAYSINDRGQIVGNGKLNGTTTAYVLTPN